MIISVYREIQDIQFFLRFKVSLDFLIEKKGEFKSFGCRNAIGIPGKYGQIVSMSVLRL